MNQFRNWLGCIRGSGKRRRRPIVNRPEEARRFLPLLEQIESRESATLLSVSGIGLAATEIALLNRPEDAAAPTRSPALPASDDFDNLNSTSLLAGSDGLSVTPPDAGGNPAPDTISGDGAPAPAAPMNDADGLLTLGSNPIPGLGSGGPNGGSSFGSSVATGGGSSPAGAGDGGGGASAVGWAGGGGGGAATPSPVLAHTAPTVDPLLFASVSTIQAFAVPHGSAPSGTTVAASPPESGPAASGRVPSFADAAGLKPAVLDNLLAPLPAAPSVQGAQSGGAIPAALTGFAGAVPAPRPHGTISPVQLASPTAGAATPASQPASIGQPQFPLLGGDPLLPVVTISSGGAFDGDAGLAPIPMVVELNIPSTQTVSVDWHTEDDSATVEDDDYVPASGTVTFAPGETNKAITVYAVGDQKFQQTELFIVRLSNAVNATIGGGGFNWAHIWEDDPAPPPLVPDDG